MRNMVESEIWETLRFEIIDIRERAAWGDIRCWAGSVPGDFRDHVFTVDGLLFTSLPFPIG